MSIKTDVVWMPTAWACYLINGDADGLEAQEITACDQYCEANGYVVLDIARDEEGNPCDLRFTWAYDLYGGATRGGDVCDYVVMVEA